MRPERARYIVRDGLIYKYRGRKCVEVMTPEDARDDGQEQILLAESVLATRPYESSDPAVPW